MSDSARVDFDATTYAASGPPSGVYIRPKVEPVYQTSEATLYQANCCDVLPYVRDVDGVISDPPWHLNGYPVHLKAVPAIAHQGEIDYFAKLWLYYGSWMTLVQQAGARWGWYFVGFDCAPAFLRMARLLGWPIQAAWPCVQHEWLFYIGDQSLPAGAHAVIAASLAKHGAPRNKPVPLVEDLLMYSPRHVGDLILDPFCGAGSTLVAATRYSLRAIGIESREEPCMAAKAALEACDGAR